MSSTVFAVELTQMQAEVVKLMFDLGPIPAMDTSLKFFSFDGVSFLLYLFR